jgi:hypothetical protein
MRNLTEAATFALWVVAIGAALVVIAVVFASSRVLRLVRGPRAAPAPAPTPRPSARTSRAS